MIYGYIRVSSKGQADNTSLEAQREAVEREGAEVIYEDVASGKDFNRGGYKKLEDSLKMGDTLIITKLDRFSRNTQDARNKIEELLNKGIKVNILNMGLIDFNTPIGKLTFTILSAFAEYEKDCINERCREGKARAKESTDFKEGRPVVHGIGVKEHSLQLLNEGHSYKKVSKMTGLSISTIQRYKRKIDAESLLEE